MLTHFVYETRAYVLNSRMFAEAETTLLKASLAKNDTWSSKCYDLIRMWSIIYCWSQSFTDEEVAEYDVAILRNMQPIHINLN